MTTTTALVLASAVIAMIVSALSLFPIRWFARSLGLLDRPGGHSSHTTPTPLGGGIGIYLGIITTVALATIAIWIVNDPTQADAWKQIAIPIVGEQLWETACSIAPGAATRLSDLWWLMGGATVLVITGLADDRRGLPVSVRLGIEFAVAAVAVIGLGMELTAFIDAPWLTRGLSIVWIVAVINSFNMLDNMDALSGGIAAIIASAMAAVMLTTPDPGTDRPQYLVAGLLLVVAGASLGFLFHNRPPARIFMGDGGSYLIGYLIAVAMLMATYAVGGPEGTNQTRPHAILAPLCAMAVPLYDMTTVLWIRIREGRNPFQGDQSHLSHRLVNLGLSRTAAVATVHLITATCGLSALLMTHVAMLQALTVLGIVGCMLTLVAILESTHWTRRGER